MKENEEENVNLNFILPEEREKHKVKILDQLDRDKENLHKENEQLSHPYNVEAMKGKEKIYFLDEERKSLFRKFYIDKEEEIESYQKKIRELGQEKDQLNESHKQISHSIENRLQKQVELMKMEEKVAKLQYLTRLDEMEKNIEKVNQAKNLT